MFQSCSLLLLHLSGVLQFFLFVKELWEKTISVLVEVVIKEECVSSIIPNEKLSISDCSYMCKLCHKTVDCLDTAKNHILAHFALPGGLTCLQCGLSFYNNVLFGIHMVNEHKNTKKWLLISSLLFVFLLKKEIMGKKLHLMV